MIEKSISKQKKEAPTAYGKYLTEMKELPPQGEGGEDTEKERKEIKRLSLQEVATKVDKPVLKEDAKKEVNQGELQGLNDSLDEPEDESKNKPPITSKDVILGVVNIISVILLIIILVRFPERSNELREARIQEIKNGLNVNIEASELDANRPKASKIEEYFLNENGVVAFIGEVEKQQVEGGAAIKVSFASPAAVKDRTGNFGVPISIELTGTWETIDTTLQRISVLPYLYRPVKVEVDFSEDDPTVIEFKYGVILYVRESLGQNR